MKAIGVLLVVAGLLGLLYGGLSYTRKEKVLEVGSIEVTADKHERVPIPPLVGGVLLVAGVLLIVRRGHAS